MYIRYANRSVERVLLRDEEGAVLCDVEFDANGNARCRKKEYELLKERGYDVEAEKDESAHASDEAEEEESDS